MTLFDLILILLSFAIGAATTWIILQNIEIWDHHDPRDKYWTYKDNFIQVLRENIFLHIFTIIGWIYLLISLSAILMGLEDTTRILI